VCDQVCEYLDCRNDLQLWNYLDFFLGTYDGKLLEERPSNRGQSLNKRVLYKEGQTGQGVVV
jgi:hypothetical protein